MHTGRGSVVVLFGAGASAYAGDVYPECPPLGVGLFERLEKEGLVDGLPSNALEVFRSESFENGMEVLRGHGNTRLVLARRLAVYFARYRTTKDDLYSRFVNLLGVSANNVVFGSLNYETLLEQALLNAKWPNLFIGSADDWLEATVAVLKPYGSCGFLPDTSRNNFPRNILYINSDPWPWECFDIFPTQEEGAIRQWCEDPAHNSIAPVIAEYSPSKSSLTGGRIMRGIRRNLFNKLKAANHIYVVGTALAPHDIHIWEPILHSNATVTIANPDGSACDWLRVNGHVGEVRHFKRGFSDYEKIAREVKVLAGCPGWFHSDSVPWEGWAKVVYEIGKQDLERRMQQATDEGGPRCGA